MMVFWLVAALLVLAAMLFLLPPLLQRDAEQDAQDRSQLNLTVYKDQLAELDADLRSGVLTDEQYRQARQDLERGLLADVSPGVAQAASVAPSRAGRGAAIVVGLMVPLVAVGMYYKLGAGAKAINPELAAVNVQAEGHEGTIEEQVRQLQEHLQEQPDDIEGRAMLARSYYFMKQYGPATEEFARVSAMVQDSDPQLLADYADALAMANGRSMAGKPYELVKKALTIEPFHQKSLWLAGTAAYQLREFPASLQYWQKLQQLFQPGSDDYQQMQRNIGEIQELMGQAPATAPTPMAASTGGASISGTVRLDAALRAKAAPTDTVFVFARAANGPRMPLAIVRKQVKDLPFDFTLDDSMAMNPAMKLSGFPEVVVGARVSKSGNAMPQSGDLSVQTSALRLGAAGKVELVIDSVVK